MNLVQKKELLLDRAFDQDQRINTREEVLKSIEVKGKVDECQKPDSKHVSSYYWCQIFDKQ